MMYLNLPELSGALHSAGHIDCVTPNIILRFSCPYHASYDWAIINACRKQTSTHGQMKPLKPLKYYKTE